MPWELYYVGEEFSQAIDLATENRENRDEMVKLFFAEAAKYNVLPLDDRKTERLNVDNRSNLTQGRKKFTYPNLLRLPEGAAPDLKHKSLTITAKVTIPETGAEGMLFTLGGRFDGYGFFVKDGRLVYHDNLAGAERFTIESKDRIPTGGVTLKAVYVTDADKPYVGTEGSTLCSQHS